MNLYKKKIERIKNMKGFVLKKDFNYSALSFLVLALFLAGGQSCNSCSTLLCHMRQLSW